MPVKFLSPQEERRYGRYNGEPSPAQLDQYFGLSQMDVTLIERRRGAHNRLGFAVQLCTVRFLGTFLARPTDVPSSVVEHLANQLGISAVDCLQNYALRANTQWEHAQEIKTALGYWDFQEQPEHIRLVRWMYTRAWMSAERPAMLFDLATAYMVERRILLPSASTLKKLVAAVRDRASQRLWRHLASLSHPELKKRLEHLLNSSADSPGFTNLERLRKEPTQVGPKGVLRAVNRFEDFLALEVNHIDTSRTPAIRLRGLARYAAVAKAQSLSRLKPERRIATLLAFAIAYTIHAQDDVVEVLKQLVHKYLAEANSDAKQNRMTSLSSFDEAALELAKIAGVVLDESVPNEEVRHRIFALSARAAVQGAKSTIEQTCLPEKALQYEVLRRKYGSIRRFLPAFLRSIRFRSTKAGRPILAGLDFLRKLEDEPDSSMRDAPREVMTRPWQQLARRNGGHLDRPMYTFCVLEQLCEGLQRRDIFLERSERWADARAKLLSDEAWEYTRGAISRVLGLNETAEGPLSQLALELDQTYRRVSARLAENTDVRVERARGKDRLSVTPLDRIDDPPTLSQLRRQIENLLPPIELTDALLEVQGFTHFAEEFVSVNPAEARPKDFAISLCAVLIAEACNIGLEPLIVEQIPALRRARLLWVQQNFLRPETLGQANARLVEAQSRIELVRSWGSGEVACADGLRFVVPVRSLYSGHNPRYFHVGRGVTYYTFTSDQFTDFHGIVIPGTLGESPHLLDGLLEQQTVLRPHELMTDTAGYSDIVFGLFWLLGYQFSPRLADLGGLRFWRIDRRAHYAALNGIARNTVNKKLIADHWDDLLRVAGSLKTGKVKASDLIRTLQRSQVLGGTGRALIELGRLRKTLYMLNFIDDPHYRRHILQQLNRGESRRALARRIFHGHSGELYQRYREGQEDQLGSLGLVLNALILWNTRYMNAAVHHLKNSGAVVREQDLQRLSPLGHRHVHLMGRYRFLLDGPSLNGDMRPLRTNWNTTARIA